MTDAKTTPEVGHSPGPWRFGSSARHVMARMGEMVALVVDNERAGANVLRVVACVNACEGVSTENLRLGDMHALVLGLEEMRRQRDGLLEACEAAYRSAPFVQGAADVIPLLEIALLKAKGGVK